MLSQVGMSTNWRAGTPCAGTSGGGGRIDGFAFDPDVPVDPGPGMPGPPLQRPPAGVDPVDWMNVGSRDLPSAEEEPW